MFDRIPFNQCLDGMPEQSNICNFIAVLADSPNRLQQLSTVNIHRQKNLRHHFLENTVCFLQLYMIGIGFWSMLQNIWKDSTVELRNEV